MPVAGQGSNAVSPWAAGAGGAVAGYGAGEAMHYLRGTRMRANAALLIGGGLLGLTLSNSGNLQSDSTNAQNNALASNALTFTTGGGVTGEEVSALRAKHTDLANIVAKLAYDSNPYNVFQTAPTAQTVTVQIASITPVTVTQVGNNSNLAMLLVVGIGIAAIAYAG